MKKKKDVKRKELVFKCYTCGNRWTQLAPLKAYVKPKCSECGTQSNVIGVK